MQDPSQADGCALSAARPCLFPLTCHVDKSKRCLLAPCVIQLMQLHFLALLARLENLLAHTAKQFCLTATSVTRHSPHLHHSHVARRSIRDHALLGREGVQPAVATRATLRGQRAVLSRQSAWRTGCCCSSWLQWRRCRRRRCVLLPPPTHHLRRGREGCRGHWQCTPSQHSLCLTRVSQHSIRWW